MTTVCYWDDATQSQKERDMTPEEEAQRLADIAAPLVPTKVTRRQALSALRIKNITAAMVESTINGLPLSQLDKDLALIEFQDSLEFEYERPLVKLMCQVMGLDRAELFIKAASL